MTSASGKTNAEFQRGWDAAIQAVRSWHEAKAKQAMVQSTRTRFPKNLEREADVHKRCAELIVTLSPDDV
jgi:lysozyme family protein